MSNFTAGVVSNS